MEPLTTVDFANDFFTNRLHAEKWEVASDEDREKAIFTASGDIIKYFVFDTPHDGVIDDRLQVGTCLQAIYLLTRNPEQVIDALTKGIKSARVGPVATEFNKDFVAPLLAPGVIDAIGDAAEYVGPSQSGTVRVRPLLT